MPLRRRTSKEHVPKDRLLPGLTLAFFNLPRITAVLWLVLTVFGVIAYSTLLRREGFPSIQIPIAVVSGAYAGSDAATVDREVAKPIADIASRQDGVSAVQSRAADNFYNLTIQYTEGTDADSAVKQLQEDIKAAGVLPEQVNPQYNVPYFGATGGDIEQIDLAMSFYADDQDVTTEELVARAEAFAAELKSRNLPTVKDVSVKNPLTEFVNPATGAAQTVQRSFDRFGTAENGQTTFYQSVLVIVAAKENVDVIELDDQIRQAASEIIASNQFSDFGVEVTASFAPNIKDNISELQRVLIEGLIAVLVVGSIVIAVRASIITVISMVTVILATVGLLYVLGYTLNVITLFGLILGLSLIVDDTIIMVEAIDAARRRNKDPRTAVLEATRKVSRAMVAATTTAALCFLPLAFVGGVLGSFIRAIPVTIISALLISLIVALVFIPLFARFLLLGKKQMGDKGVREVAAGVEHKIANFILKPMLWARSSKKRLLGVGLTALFVGTLFIGSGLALSQKVVFNIFPPTKDTNGINININFPAGTDIGEAQAIAQDAETISEEVIGDNFVRASYFATGSAQSALFQVELTSYSKRDITSPQLVEQLQNRYDEFGDAQITAAQVDLGPPTAAFNINISGDDRAAAYRLAEDIESYMEDAELVRPSGEVARFENVNISSPDQYIRTDGDSVIQLSASFDGSDTTTLVTLAQAALDERYTDERLQSFGLSPGALQYDLGQEQENQDSFQTLALAFPLLLIVIFLLLALQFRSLLQPLLIFMAIPFSIFGIMLGLYLTNNAISFFAALGFFALIGLSIKNTILLTDFANQARAAGLGPVDAAAAALRERFRPLIATSLTAVVSLIPLAITSPFWQGLAVVLIFGLTSSTLLVLLVFPYYYLGAEYLRINLSRKRVAAWLVATAVVVYAVLTVVSIPIAVTVAAISLLALIVSAFVVPRGSISRRLYVARSRHES